MFQTCCVVLLIVAMMYIVREILHSRQHHIADLMIWSIFLVYTSGYLYFTVFSRQMGSGAFVELRPFQVYTRLFAEPIDAGNAAIGFAAKFLNNTPPIVGLILNILLYYPLGYLLPILFPKLKPKHVILIGCLCSIATEAIQYLLKMGWCETDDVIHNTLGTAIGVWVWLWQSKRLNLHRSANPGKGET